MAFVPAPRDNVAVVSVDAAHVRTSPSLAGGVIAQVKYGSQRPAIGQNADWFNVALPDSRQGWVAAGWITMRVNNDPANGYHGG
ncbi:MAG: SH3 domain-containing protein [Chloroflexi bacterium]|nr:SH3 domain-containing protein [Chloroflexota bacterium]